MSFLFKLKGKFGNKIGLIYAEPIARKKKEAVFQYLSQCKRFIVLLIVTFFATL